MSKRWLLVPALLGVIATNCKKKEEPKESPPTPSSPTAPASPTKPTEPATPSTPTGPTTPPGTPTTDAGQKPDAGTPPTLDTPPTTDAGQKPEPTESEFVPVPGQRPLFAYVKINNPMGMAKRILDKAFDQLEKAAAQKGVLSSEVQPNVPIMWFFWDSPDVFSQSPNQWKNEWQNLSMAFFIPLKPESALLKQMEPGMRKDLPTVKFIPMNWEIGGTSYQGVLVSWNDKTEPLVTAYRPQLEAAIRNSIEKSVAQSKTEPDVVVSFQVDSLWQQYGDKIQQALHAELERSMMNPQKLAFQKSMMSNMTDMLSNLRRIEFRGNWGQDTVEVAFTENWKPGHFKGNYAIREEALARLLPSTAWGRIQLASLSEMPAYTEKVLAQVKQMIQQEKPELAGPVDTFLTGMMKVIVNSQIAFSVEPTVDGKMVDAYAIIYPQDPQGTLDALQGMVRVFNEGAIGEKMNRDGVKFSIDNTPGKCGSTQQECKRMVVTLANDQIGKSISAEAVVYGSYVLIHLGPDTQGMNKLITSIETKQGQPLHAMKAFPNHGSMYLDLDLGKIMSFYMAMKSHGGPSPDQLLLQGLSPEQTTLMGFVNDDMNNQVFKLRLSTALIQRLITAGMMARTRMHTMPPAEPTTEPASAAPTPATNPPGNPE